MELNVNISWTEIRLKCHKWKLDWNIFIFCWLKLISNYWNLTKINFHFWQSSKTKFKSTNQQPKWSLLWSTSDGRWNARVLGCTLWYSWMSTEFQANHFSDFMIFQSVGENYDLLMVLEKKWRTHQSQKDSSSGDCLYKISWHLIQKLRSFSLNQSGGHLLAYTQKKCFTDAQCHPKWWIANVIY